MSGRIEPSTCTYRVRTATRALMSILVNTSTSPARLGIPRLPWWAVPRRRLADQLDAGEDGLAAVVNAPPGTGKTTAVASWAANLPSSVSVVWLKLSSRSTDPDAAFRQQIAGALLQQRPSVIVLDDLPAEPSFSLSQHLEMLLSQADHQLSVVLICSGSAALPLYLDLGSADLMKIGFKDLVMDEGEVKLVLDQHGVTATEATIRAVLEHTVGWACGVRLAALSLQRSGSVEAALRETDEQINRFFDSKIISKLPRVVRDMIVVTSVAEEVPAELAYSMAGSDTGLLLDAIAGYDGFIELRTDGSFRCHPLLRRAALARFARRSPSAVQGAHRQAAQWAARAHVRSLVVPRMLAGAGSDVVQQVVESKEVAESEPLLLAAAALAHSWFDIAESALARATSELAQAPQPETTDVFSLALLTMAMLRQRGEPLAGLAQARQLRDLMAKLTASERAQAPELLPLIDYYVAGFELSMGNVATARWTLERGAGRGNGSSGDQASVVEQLAHAGCAGQLSWIDAFCGDLRRATRYATSLLTDRQADSGESGVRFAHLATAWTHLERGEISQARQRLDHALSASADSPEPLLAAAQLLTQARLAMVTDEPETALRLLTSASTLDTPSGWFADQFFVASADAWLAAGEPQQAIARLSPEPPLAPAEARLILARALHEVGDLRAAEAMLARVPSDPTAISVITQVRRWLLEAEWAVARGNHERAELLVDRALRTAAREQLRTTISSASGWLQSFVARDSGLSGRHSAFLASVLEPVTAALDHPREDAGVYDALIVVPLTAREIDVLNLLAEFCSNEEIAADLVLSLNTVKTHMRSLFQKLSVTRRADAVRRGRALGLC
jgi:LuxR family transcriptional regulator, maltose regulon positive regulatory protein